MQFTRQVGFSPGRPRDAARQIRSVLSKTDCLSCGICCTHDKAIPVTGMDPNKTIVRNFLQSGEYSKRMESAPNGGFNILVQGRCPALGQEDGKHECSIYDFRPIFCKIFPFVPGFIRVEVDGEVSVAPMIQLDNMCPPIRELECMGIGYVLFSDIATSRTDNGKQTLQIEKNFLGASLQNLLLTINWGVLFSRKDILITGKGPIFPIL